MSTTAASSKKDGQLVLGAMIAFFVVFASVDAYFVYSALSTHTGVIDKHPYETGLMFNDRLAQAEKQKAMDLQTKAEYNAPILQLSLLDKDGDPLQGAMVTAKIIRPVQDGYDFETVLNYKGGGLFQANLDLPLEGLWLAQIEAQWQDNKQQQTYQTEMNFVQP